MAWLGERSTVRSRTAAAATGARARRGRRSGLAERPHRDRGGAVGRRLYLSGRRGGGAASRQADGAVGRIEPDTGRRRHRRTGRSIASNLGVWVTGQPAAGGIGERTQPAGRIGPARPGRNLGPAPAQVPGALLPPRHGVGAAARHQAGAGAGRTVSRAEAWRSTCAGGACRRPQAGCQRPGDHRLGTPRQSPPRPSRGTGHHPRARAARLRREDRRGRIAPAHAAGGGRVARCRPGHAGDAGRRSTSWHGWCTRQSFRWRGSA